MLKVKDPSLHLVLQPPPSVGKVLWVLGSVRGRGAALAAHIAALGCKPVWELAWSSTSTAQPRVKWGGVCERRDCAFVFLAEGWK